MSDVSITLLCEDSQTDSFVRRFLRRRKFRGRDIRTLPLPAGRRSGEQWVRKQYPAELRAVRGRQGAYLIVVTDADDRSTNERREQLDAECGKQDVPVRTGNDPVILVVPRRNIETWLAYLETGKPVDEQERYPRLKRERDCNRHADNLFKMCHSGQRLDEAAPPSLREACAEYRKLQR